MEKLTKSEINVLKTFTREKQGNLKKASDITGVSTTTIRNAMKGLEVSLLIKFKILPLLKWKNAVVKIKLKKRCIH